MPKQTVGDIEVSGRKVLVRVDFNVPQTADGGSPTTAGSERIADLECRSSSAAAV